MQSRKWYFVLPDIQDIPSGGNLYNAQLIGALREQQIALEVLDFDHYRLARERQQPGLYWIDTLFLEQFRQLAVPLPGAMQHGLIVHHLDSLYPPEGVHPDAFYAQKEAAVLPRFRWFLVTSAYTGQYLQNRGFGAERIIVAPPALSFEPEQRDNDTEEIRALMVANLVERKGVLPFLQGLAERMDQMGPFSLTIVGSDEIEPDYAAACFALLQRHTALRQSVHLTGSLMPRKTQRYYRHANLYVSTAYMETYGMALQEARAYRLPILALEGGNVGFHVQPGKNGCIFPILAELLDGFQRLSLEPERFRQLHQSALQCHTEDAYNWQEVAQRIVNALPQDTWKK